MQLSPFLLRPLYDVAVVRASRPHPLPAGAAEGLRDTVLTTLRGQRALHR